MRAHELLVEFYNPDDDQLAKANMDDTRRPRLTMSHLQKLRKAHDVSKVEMANHRNFLPDMYGVQPEQGLM